MSEINKFISLCLCSNTVRGITTRKTSLTWKIIPLFKNSLVVDDIDSNWHEDDLLFSQNLAPWYWTKKVMVLFVHRRVFLLNTQAWEKLWKYQHNDCFYHKVPGPYELVILLLRSLLPCQDHHEDELLTKYSSSVSYPYYSDTWHPLSRFLLKSNWVCQT